MAYVQGTVSVGTTATLIATPRDGAGGIYIQNGGSVAVILGGSNVTASGATAGISLAASSGVLVPTRGQSDALYGITGSSTANVSYIYPG